MKEKLLLLAALSFPLIGNTQEPPLLSKVQIAALAQELSGGTAEHNLEGIIRNHRQRGSRGFHAAAELVAERARAYGLSDVEILQFAADGKVFYGSQRSRPPWDADFGELWELSNENGKWNHKDRIASYDDTPVSLAEDSESADVTADLIDAADGTRESDYSGKDVRGKIVLVGAQPSAAQELAVEKLGAAGIISYALNQPQAWQGEDPNLIRWGHLQSFPKTKTFAFMISPKTASVLRARLAHGERIRLHAIVRAGQHAGNYEIVTGIIPGSDPRLKHQEIAFSCHLDHQQPGANDNASGCATILEVARSLCKLIGENKLAPPPRTLRFIWPPEVEGTAALLNAHADFAQHIKAVIHMDMVGGSPQTKAVFHVTRGPLSLPSFIFDVAEAFAFFVNQQTERFANTGEAEYPLLAAGGGKDPLRAEFASYSMGSDHDVYQDSSFKIPTILLNDWPDRYIHTNGDTAANIDPTKLRRAAFIGAATGYYLAQVTDKDAGDICEQIRISSLRRHASEMFRIANLSSLEAANLFDHEMSYFRESVSSFVSFTSEVISSDSASCAPSFVPQSKDNVSVRTGPTSDALLIYRRNVEPKGPLVMFGYDYLEEHAKAAGVSAPKLLNYRGLWGSGEEYGFETLNFIDGKLNAEQIRDAVSAEYGPIPLEMVVEYLKTLEMIGVIHKGAVD